MLYKSVKIEYDIAMTKVYFFPPHLEQNANWPDLYIFMTSTRVKLPFQLAEGELVRVKDGLILSEHYLR